MRQESTGAARSLNPLCRMSSCVRSIFPFFSQPEDVHIHLVDDRNIFSPSPNLYFNLGGRAGLSPQICISIWESPGRALTLPKFVFQFGKVRVGLSPPQICISIWESPGKALTLPKFVLQFGEGRVGQGLSTSGCPVQQDPHPIKIVLADQLHLRCQRLRDQPQGVSVRVMAVDQPDALMPLQHRN